MQELEDALNVSMCGHFLIMLATMCFAAFSGVTVQYKSYILPFYYFPASEIYTLTFRKLLNVIFHSWY
jgi:hypothetical protein